MRRMPISSFSDVALRIFPLLLFTTVATLLLASCGGSQQAASTSPPSQGTGTVSFSVAWEAPPEGAARVLNFPRAGARGSAVRPLAHVDNVCEDYGIEWVIMQVLDNAMSPSAERLFECFQHQGVINNVTAGVDLRVRLIGRAQGIEKWTGTSPRFNLAPGGNGYAGLIPMEYTYRGPGWDNVAPRVTSTIPQYGGTNVRLNSPLKIVFSEPMARSSVEDNEAILVVDNNSPTPNRIPGSIIYYPLDNSAIFYPSAPLSFGMNHTVTVDSVMTDMAGRPLSNAPYSWTFRAHGSGEWAPEFPVTDNLTRTWGGPQVAMGVKGYFQPGMDKAMVVWVSPDRHLWAREYSVGTGQGGVATPIDNGVGITSSSLFRVAMDNTGNTIVIWKKDGPNRLYANRYSATTRTWGTAIPIDNTTGGYEDEPPRLAMDWRGNAMAVWHGRTAGSNKSRVWYNRFIATTGQWGQPGLVQDPGDLQGAGWASEPELAVHPQNGAAYVVWSQDNTIWFNYFSGSVWGTPLPVQTRTDPYEPIARLGANRYGNGIIVWSDNNDIYYRRFTGSGTLPDPAYALDTSHTGSDPQVVTDMNSNTLVLYKRDSTLVYRISIGGSDSWSFNYFSEFYWPYQLIMGSDIMGSDYPGNVYLIWSGDKIRVRMAVYKPPPNPTYQWKTLDTLNDTISGSRPWIAADIDNNVMAVWNGYDVVNQGYRVWGNLIE